MKYLITMITFFFVWSVQAQQLEKQVISSTGNDVSLGGIQLSQTIGESVVETFTSGSFILGQGFQQEDEKTAIAIEELDLIVNYNLFPNPTQDIINLELVLENANANIKLELVDVQGRLIAKKELELESNNTLRTQFSLVNESTGIYFLKISDARGNVTANLEISKF